MVYWLLVIPWMGTGAFPAMFIIGLVTGDLVLISIGLATTILSLAAWVGWLAWYVGALQRSFKYSLTKDTLTIERGVFWRKTSRIPLRRVQDVVNKQGPFLRAASVGSVHVQTAGLSAQSGGFGVEGLMVGLEDPVAVAEEILGKVKKLKGDV